MRLKNIKLTRQERAIEDALIKGEYVKSSKAEFERIARMITERRKDAVLNIRINKYDLQSLKEKARKHGVKYQTFIAEILHRVAHN